MTTPADVLEHAARRRRHVGDVRAIVGADARAAASVWRPRHLSVPSAVLSRCRRRGARARGGGDALDGSASAWPPRPSVHRRCSPTWRSATTRSGWRRSIPATARPAPRHEPTPSSCRIRCSSPSTTRSRRPGSATASCWPKCSTVSRSWPRSASASTPASRGRSRRCSRRCSRVTANGAAPRRRRGSRSSTGARCRPSASSRSCATPSSRSACRRSSAIRAISSSRPARDFPPARAAGSTPTASGSIWSTGAS